jgi:hypothetical protein
VGPVRQTTGELGTLNEPLCVRVANFQAQSAVNSLTKTKHTAREISHVTYLLSSTERNRRRPESDPYFDVDVIKSALEMYPIISPARSSKGTRLFTAQVQMLTTMRWASVSLWYLLYIMHIIYYTDLHADIAGWSRHARP